MSRVYDRQTNHWHFIGLVELEEPPDTKIYADDVEAWVDQNRVVATGNVLYISGNNRIAADRADVNTKTKLGTFYGAWGIASIPPPKPRPPGAGVIITSPVTGKDTDVYFFGDEIEKIGPQKYKIKNGGFSTCVQPTPRWNLSAETVILNIDHYTVLKQAILNVKGVPLLYLPVLYYPTKKDGRATGFLLPTYGSSTIAGQSIHNGFFWAIDRSQDATIMYDWYSQGGQGVGTRYRYNEGPTSNGNIDAYTLDQQQSALLPASHSLNVQGGMNQSLPWNLRMRGNINYFSNIATNQTFNTDVYNASQSQRSFGINLVGAWRNYSLNVTANRSEVFYNPTDSIVTGGLPKIDFNRTERPLFDGSPVYFSVGSELVDLVRGTKTDQCTDGGRTPPCPVASDTGLARMDFTPQIRYPFKKWQWFTVSTSISWRDTFYTRSQDPTTTDPVTQQPTVIDRTLNRQYFTFASQIIGPTFTRIWDTPGNHYAERFKHTIEPFLNVQRTTAINQFPRIVQTDGTDGIVGKATSFTYGVHNRFYAKRKVGSTSQAQEILDVGISQSYYSDATSAQYDLQYSTSTATGCTQSFVNTCTLPSHFSPVLLDIRVTPSRVFDGTVHAEYDGTYHALRTLTTGGNHTWTNRLRTSVTWSQNFLVSPLLQGFNLPGSHYLTVSTNAHTEDNHFGGLYSFNYGTPGGCSAGATPPCPTVPSAMLQQQVTGFYNAQCCGIAFQYQTYNFGPLSILPPDHRFFLSFTLAGLGNFSPFNGAMSGAPH